MIKRPRKDFEVEGLTLTTSSYTKHTDTDWCVGVGSECLCHTAIGDSKTRELALSFRNSEFLSVLATIK